MNKLAVATIPFVVLATACLDASVDNAASQLAVACKVDVVVAAAALASEVSLPDDPPPTGGSLAVACCDNAKGCKPMDYPINSCATLPAPSDATVLALTWTRPYDSDTTTQYFANCDPPPGGQCNADAAAYVFQPYPQTRWVAAFVSDGQGGTTAEVYRVPEGTRAVRIPSGAQVFPLLEESDGYANEEREVETPDGMKFVDDQNDCVPREDGCGFTCATC